MHRKMNPLSHSATDFAKTAVSTLKLGELTKNLSFRDYARIGLFGLGMGAMEYLKDIDQGAFVTATPRAAVVAIAATYAALRTNTNPRMLAFATMVMNLVTFEQPETAFLHSCVAGFAAHEAEAIVKGTEDAMDAMDAVKALCGLRC